MFILDYSGEEDNAARDLVDAVHRNFAIDWLQKQPFKPNLCRLAREVENFVVRSPQYGHFIDLVLS